MSYLSGNNDSANSLSDPGTVVLLAHTGTLDTTGHNGVTNRSIPRGPGTGDDVLLGSDNSAASINKYLDPDANNLAPGSVAGPTYTAPIY